MPIARVVSGYMQSSSWIRKMFETGFELKQKHGAENVFDLTLGNPLGEPPEAVTTAFRELTAAATPGAHGYMQNMGYEQTRRAMADYVSGQEDVDLGPESVVMTVGAAGGLNVALASILDPGDEVIVLLPFFAEYRFYILHHNGVMVSVETTDDFDLNPAAVEAAVSERTRAIIVNTPNNPTGRIYSDQAMAELGQILTRAEQKNGRPIYLLADTPYARIVYDGAKNPNIFKHHDNTILAHSFSKELGLAGERIGFLAISPRAADPKLLFNALTFNNRTLGFVNAPALVQRVAAQAVAAGAEASMDIYSRCRDILCEGLDKLGYSFVKPEGAFYLFPRSPIADDLAFSEKLAEELVLVVPGRGFGREGHIRIAYCTDPKVVEGALPAFGRVLDQL